MSKPVDSTEFYKSLTQIKTNRMAADKTAQELFNARINGSGIKNRVEQEVWIPPEKRENSGFQPWNSSQAVSAVAQTGINMWEQNVNTPVVVKTWQQPAQISVNYTPQYFQPHQMPMQYPVLSGPSYPANWGQDFLPIRSDLCHLYTRLQKGGRLRNSPSWKTG